MPSRTAVGNFWFDNTNLSKWCVEGAVTNLLCELLSIQDVAKLKKIAICNGEQFITAMNGQSIPKIVLSKTGQIDAMEKCMCVGILVAIARERSEAVYLGYVFCTYGTNNNNNNNNSHYATTRA